MVGALFHGTDAAEQLRPEAGIVEGVKNRHKGPRIEIRPLRPVKVQLVLRQVRDFLAEILGKKVTALPKSKLSMFFM